MVLGQVGRQFDTFWLRAPCIVSLDAAGTAPYLITHDLGPILLRYSRCQIMIIYILQSCIIVASQRSSSGSFHGHTLSSRVYPRVSMPDAAKHLELMYFRKSWHCKAEGKTSNNIEAELRGRTACSLLPFPLQMIPS